MFCETEKSPLIVQDKECVSIKPFSQLVLLFAQLSKVGIDVIHPPNEVFPLRFHTL